jgi:hypothetical protein
MADYVMNTEGKYGVQIVQELDKRFTGPSPFNEIYKQWGRRLLYIDEHVVPGAFQMNTTWYVNAPDFDPLPYHEEHIHDFDEMIGFLGSDPTDKYDLGGVIEIGINGEKHRLTKSSIIFIPGGMKHLPLTILELRRPILHFSVSMSGEYSLRLTKEEPERSADHLEMIAEIKSE